MVEKTRNAVDRKVSRVRIPNSPPQKACNHADYRLFYFCPKDKPARSSVFRGENQLFSPALIELQRLPKSPPSGRTSPVSAVINRVTVTQLLKVAMRSGSGNADACYQFMPVQILGVLRLACPWMIHMKEKAIPVGTAFALC